MTSQKDGEPARYDVVVSEHLRAIIKQMHRHAEQQGEGNHS
jgi:hypothetical protein